MRAGAIAPAVRNRADRVDPKTTSSATGGMPLLFEVAGDGFVQPLGDGEPK